MYLGKCVVLDELIYIIRSVVSVKDPERPGNTTKEYFLLLNTVVDDYKELLSMYAAGRGPRPPNNYKNKCHKYIPAATTKELTASIFQAGATDVIDKLEPNNPAPAAGVSSTHVAAPAVSAETSKPPVHDLAQQPADQAASVEQAGASGPASTDPSNT